MDKLTLRQSTIVGTVHGKPIMCTVRASPPGLLLPAGQYVLHAPVDNPVYGQVMSIEPARRPLAAPGEIYVKAPPASGIMKTPASELVKPSAVRPAADAPSTIKFQPPELQPGAPAALKANSPSIKYDTAAGGAAQPVLIAGRPIAGNCLVVTAGLGDLFDAVRGAGGVMLVVD